MKPVFKCFSNGTPSKFLTSPETSSNPWQSAEAAILHKISGVQSWMNNNRTAVDIPNVKRICQFTTYEMNQSIMGAVYTNYLGLLLIFP